MTNKEKLNEYQKFIDAAPSENHFIQRDENGDIFYIQEKSLSTLLKWKDAAQSEILEIKLSESYPKFD